MPPGAAGERIRGARGGILSRWQAPGRHHHGLQGQGLGRPNWSPPLDPYRPRRVRAGGGVQPGRAKFRHREFRSHPARVVGGDVAAPADVERAGGRGVRGGGQPGRRAARLRGRKWEFEDLVCSFQTPTPHPMTPPFPTSAAWKAGGGQLLPSPTSPPRTPVTRPERDHQPHNRPDAQHHDEGQKKVKGDTKEPRPLLVVSHRTSPSTGRVKWTIASYPPWEAKANRVNSYA